MSNDEFLELIGDDTPDQEKEAIQEDSQELTQEQEEQLWLAYYESIGFFNH